MKRFGVVVWLMCIAGAASGQPSGSASDDPFEAELARRVSDVGRQPQGARGAGALLRLHRLREESDDLAVFARVYESAIVQGDTPVRTTAQLLLTDIEPARGNTARALALRSSLGFIQRFHVLGGFDNDAKAGCAVNFGPESKLDLAVGYAATGREVFWRPHDVVTPDGFVDLGAALRPSREVVGYAATFLKTKQAGKVTLALGTSGAFRLWVNGAEVFRDDTYHAPRPDQVRLAVPVRAGHNTLLLKVCHADGPFGFYLRTEPGGARVEASLQPPPAPTRAAPAIRARRLQSLAELGERTARNRPKDEWAYADWAIILDATRAYDESSKKAQAAAESAASLSPKSLAMRHLAASLQRDDNNAKREHLEAARQHHPDSALALLALARFEQTSGRADRAHALLSRVVRESPNFLLAELLLARVEEELGQFSQAHARIESLLRRHPRHPLVLKEAARNARRSDRTDEAIARLRGFLSLRQDDENVRRELAGLLADVGRIDDALAELAVLAEQNPADAEFAVRQGELCAANDRTGVARGHFARGRALAPDDADFREREGRALLGAGFRDEAIVAYEQALALKPQNPGLRQTLRTLRGGQVQQGSDALLDVASLLPEAARYAEDDAVVLADVTHVRVQSSGLASRLTQRVVRVQTQRGVDAFRSLPLTYAPNRQEIRILKARITKPDGSIVDGHSETERNINEPWTGLYYDARARQLSFPSLDIGDVLELQYRLEDTANENLLADSFGDFEFVQGPATKVRWRYVVEMPSHRPLHWNQATLSPLVQASSRSVSQQWTRYEFEAAHVPRVVQEPSMPGWSERAAHLHVSTFKNWDEVGQYYWNLIKEQLVPDDAIRTAVNTLLQKIDRKDAWAVVRALYAFVVSETRYVALEFGIHGYKPYRVDRIFARRFGDCKDKASLLYAMLQVAGIDSRIVLLRMRHLGPLAEAPASLAAFNHAILYVPGLDLFLDGTAELHGVTELPSSDRSASVLVVEPEGASRFLQTAEARLDDNVTELTLRTAVRPDGSATLQGETRIRGQSAPEFRRSYRTAATRRANFEQSWAQYFPGMRVDEVNMPMLENIEAPVQVSYTLHAPRFAERTHGDTIRFSAFPVVRSYAQTYATLRERRHDIVLSHPFRNVLRFEHTLPKGYGVGDASAPEREESSFGSVEASCTSEGERVKCEARFSLRQTRIPPQTYPAFRAFLNRVDQILSRRLVARPPR
ncbi:MAG: DUF3857 domain-containing protein [Myxococcaceae bacterium]